MDRGYITLISVLIVTAISVAVASSLLLLGVGSSRTSFALEQSNQAKNIASACAEEALLKIKELTSYTGEGTISVGLGVCEYSVTSQGGQNRTIQTLGIVGSITRRVEIIIDSINPDIHIISWQEVSSF